MSPFATFNVFRITYALKSVVLFSIFIKEPETTLPSDSGPAKVVHDEASKLVCGGNVKPGRVAPRR
jgi:hypothetical protein